LIEPSWSILGVAAVVVAVVVVVVVAIIIQEVPSCHHQTSSPTPRALLQQPALPIPPYRWKEMPLDHRLLIPPPSTPSCLKRDTEPKGQRNFIPFFRHYDLLRLSECSKDLMGYRHHLSEILLSNPHPSITGTDDHDAEVMRGIMGLLSAQERGGSGLDCLAVSDRYVLKLLKSTVEGLNQCRVKKLLLGLNNLGGEDISSIFMSGVMRGIQELSLQVRCDWGAVFGTLGQGACPDLLRLSMMDPTESQCVALARALRSGCCSQLQELAIVGEPSRPSRSGRRLVFEALQEGSCPNLTKIDLGNIPATLSYESLALANLLRSRACPQLKALLLGDIHWNNEEMVAVMEALLDGNYSHLTHLWFGTMHSAGNRRRLSASGSCPSYPLGGRYPPLQELHVGGV